MTLEIRLSKGKQTAGQAEMHSGAKSRIIRRIELEAQGACSVSVLLDLPRTAKNKNRQNAIGFRKRWKPAARQLLSSSAKLKAALKLRRAPSGLRELT